MVVTLEQIPPGKYNYFDWPTFATYPKPDGTWHVFGPEKKVLVGEVVEVNRYENEPDAVEILEVVAERVVRRRNGEHVRFVMATFDKVVTEVPDAEHH